MNGVESNEERRAIILRPNSPSLSVPGYRWALTDRGLELVPEEGIRPPTIEPSGRQGELLELAPPPVETTTGEYMAPAMPADRPWWSKSLIAPLTEEKREQLRQRITQYYKEGKIDPVTAFVSGMQYGLVEVAEDIFTPVGLAVVPVSILVSAFKNGRKLFDLASAVVTSGLAGLNLASLAQKYRDPFEAGRHAGHALVDIAGFKLSIDSLRKAAEVVRPTTAKAEYIGRPQLPPGKEPPGPPPRPPAEQMVIEGAETLSVGPGPELRLPPGPERRPPGPPPVTPPYGGPGSPPAPAPATRKAPPPARIITEPQPTPPPAGFWLPPPPPEEFSVTPGARVIRDVKQVLPRERRGFSISVGDPLPDRPGSVIEELALVEEPGSTRVVARYRSAGEVGWADVTDAVVGEPRAARRITVAERTRAYLGLPITLSEPLADYLLRATSPQPPIAPTARPEAVSLAERDLLGDSPASTLELVSDYAVQPEQLLGPLKAFDVRISGYRPSEAANGGVDVDFTITNADIDQALASVSAGTWPVVRAEGQATVDLSNPTELKIVRLSALPGGGVAGTITWRPTRVDYSAPVVLRDSPIVGKAVLLAMDESGPLPGVRGARELTEIGRSIIERVPVVRPVPSAPAVKPEPIPRLTKAQSVVDDASTEEPPRPSNIDQFVPPSRIVSTANARVSSGKAVELPARVRAALERVGVNQLSAESLSAIRGGSVVWVATLPQDADQAAIDELTRAVAEYRRNGWPMTVTRSPDGSVTFAYFEPIGNIEPASDWERIRSAEASVYELAAGLLDELSSISAPSDRNAAISLAVARLARSVPLSSEQFRALLSAAASLLAHGTIDETQVTRLAHMIAEPSVVRETTRYAVPVIGEPGVYVVSTETTIAGLKELEKPSIGVTTATALMTLMEAYKLPLSVRAKLLVEAEKGSIPQEGILAAIRDAIDRYPMVTLTELRRLGHSEADVSSAIQYIVEAGIGELVGETLKLNRLAQVMRSIELPDPSDEEELAAIVDHVLAFMSADPEELADIARTEPTPPTSRQRSSVPYVPKLANIDRTTTFDQIAYELERHVAAENLSDLAGAFRTGAASGDDILAVSILTGASIAGRRPAELAREVASVVSAGGNGAEFLIEVVGDKIGRLLAESFESRGIPTRSKRLAEEFLTLTAPLAESAPPKGLESVWMDLRRVINTPSYETAPESERRVAAAVAMLAIASLHGNWRPALWPSLADRRLLWLARVISSMPKPEQRSAFARAIGLPENLGLSLPLLLAVAGVGATFSVEAATAASEARQRVIEGLISARNIGLLGDHTVQAAASAVTGEPIRKFFGTAEPPPATAPEPEYESLDTETYWGVAKVARSGVEMDQVDSATLRFLDATYTSYDNVMQVTLDRALLGKRLVLYKGVPLEQLIRQARGVVYTDDRTVEVSGQRIELDPEMYEAIRQWYAVHGIPQDSDPNSSSLVAFNWLVDTPYYRYWSKLIDLANSGGFQRELAFYAYLTIAKDGIWLPGKKRGYRFVMAVSMMPPWDLDTVAKAAILQRHAGLSMATAIGIAEASELAMALSGKDARSAAISGKLAELAARFLGTLPDGRRVRVTREEAAEIAKQFIRSVVSHQRIVGYDEATERAVLDLVLRSYKDRMIAVLKAAHGEADARQLGIVTGSPKQYSHRAFVDLRKVRHRDGTTVSDLVAATMEQLGSYPISLPASVNARRLEEQFGTYPDSAHWMLDVLSATSSDSLYIAGTPWYVAAAKLARGGPDAEEVASAAPELAEKLKLWVEAIGLKGQVAEYGDLVYHILDKRAPFYGSIQEYVKSADVPADVLRWLIIASFFTSKGIRDRYPNPLSVVIGASGMKLPTLDPEEIRAARAATSRFGPAGGQALAWIAKRVRTVRMRADSSHGPMDVWMSAVKLWAMEAAAAISFAGYEHELSAEIGTNVSLGLAELAGQDLSARRFEIYSDALAAAMIRFAYQGVPKEMAPETLELYNKLKEIAPTGTWVGLGPLVHSDGEAIAAFQLMELRLAAVRARRARPGEPSYGGLVPTYAMLDPPKGLLRICFSHNRLLAVSPERLSEAVEELTRINMAPDMKRLVSYGYVTASRAGIIVNEVDAPHVPPGVKVIYEKEPMTPGVLGPFKSADEAMEQAILYEQTSVYRSEFGTKYTVIRTDPPSRESVQLLVEAAKRTLEKDNAERFANWITKAKDKIYWVVETNTAVRHIRNQVGTVIAVRVGRPKTVTDPDELSKIVAAGPPSDQVDVETIESYRATPASPVVSILDHPFSKQILRAARIINQSEALLEYIEIRMVRSPQDVIIETDFKPENRDKVIAELAVAIQTNKPISAEVIAKISTPIGEIVKGRVSLQLDESVGASEAAKSLFEAAMRESEGLRADSAEIVLRMAPVEFVEASLNVIEEGLGEQQLLELYNGFNRAAAKGVPKVVFVTDKGTVELPSVITEELANKLHKSVRDALSPTRLWLYGRKEEVEPQPGSFARSKVNVRLLRAAMGSEYMVAAAMELLGVSPAPYFGISAKDFADTIHTMRSAIEGKPRYAPVDPYVPQDAGIVLSIYPYANTIGRFGFADGMLACIVVTTSPPPGSAYLESAGGVHVRVLRTGMGMPVVQIYSESLVEAAKPGAVGTQYEDELARLISTALMIAAVESPHSDASPFFDDDLSTLITATLSMIRGGERRLDEAVDKARKIAETLFARLGTEAIPAIKALAAMIAELATYVEAGKAEAETFKKVADYAALIEKPIERLKAEHYEALIGGVYGARRQAAVYLAGRTPKRDWVTGRDLLQSWSSGRIPGIEPVIPAVSGVPEEAGARANVAEIASDLYKKVMAELQRWKSQRTSKPVTRVAIIPSFFGRMALVTPKTRIGGAAGLAGTVSQAAPILATVVDDYRDLTEILQCEYALILFDQRPEIVAHEVLHIAIDAISGSGKHGQVSGLEVRDPTFYGRLLDKELPRWAAESLALFMALMRGPKEPMSTTEIATYITQFIVRDIGVKDIEATVDYAYRHFLQLIPYSLNLTSRHALTAVYEALRAGISGEELELLRLSIEPEPDLEKVIDHSVASTADLAALRLQVGADDAVLIDGPDFAVVKVGSNLASAIVLDKPLVVTAPFADWIANSLGVADIVAQARKLAGRPQQITSGGPLVSRMRAISHGAYWRYKVVVISPAEVDVRTDAKLVDGTLSVIRALPQLLESEVPEGVTFRMYSLNPEQMANALLALVRTGGIELSVWAFDKAREILSAVAKGADVVASALEAEKMLTRVASIATLDPFLRPMSAMAGLLWPAGELKASTVNIRVDEEWVRKVMETALYSNRSSATAVREAIQNAVDATRTAVQEGLLKPEEAKVYVLMDLSSKQVTVEDKGKGMTLDEIKNYMLTIGGSGKRSHKYASGGFGVAKVSIFGIPNKVRITTISNDPAFGGQLTLHKIMTDKDMFSRGELELESIPMSTGRTGTTVRMIFDSLSLYEITNFVKSCRTEFKIEIINVSPYIDPHVSVSSKTDPKFDKDLQYLETIEIRGGTVDLYVDLYETPVTACVEILNRGLFVGETSVYSNVEGRGYEFIANVHPTVEEGHPDYPFTLNREGMEGDALEKLKEAVSRHLSRIRKEALEAEVRQLMRRTQVAGLDVLDPFDITSSDKWKEFMKKGGERVFTEAYLALKRLDLICRADEVIRSIVRKMDHELYAGMAARVYGLNFEIEGRKGYVILINIPSIFGTWPSEASLDRDPYEAAAAFALKLIDTYAHELAHNSVRWEGYEHQHTTTAIIQALLIRHRKEVDEIVTAIVDASAPVIAKKPDAVRLASEITSEVDIRSQESELIRRIVQRTKL